MSEMKYLAQMLVLYKCHLSRYVATLDLSPN